MPLPSLFPDADPLAVDLLTKLLAFDPSDRITVSEAIAHPYLASYHEIGDEPQCPIIAEKWKAIEEIESDFEYRKAIWREVYEFRLSVRSGIEGANEEEEGIPPLNDEDEEVMDDEEALTMVKDASIELEVSETVKPGGANGVTVHVTGTASYACSKLVLISSYRAQRTCSS